MFAVKWAVNGIVETAVDTTTHTVNLVTDNIRYQTNNVYHYITHFNQTPAAQVIEKYNSNTAEIIARHNFRKQEAMAKKMQNTPALTLQQENFKIRIYNLQEALMNETNKLNKSYFRFLNQQVKNIKNAELKVLKHLLQAENFSEMHLFATYELTNLWAQTKKSSPVLELLQDIMSVQIPYEQTLKLR